MNNEPKNARIGDLGPNGRVQDCWTRHNTLKDKSDLNHGTCEPMVESGRDTRSSERQIHFRGNMPDEYDAESAWNIQKVAPTCLAKFTVGGAAAWHPTEGATRKVSSWGARVQADTAIFKRHRHVTPRERWKERRRKGHNVVTKQNEGRTSEKHGTVIDDERTSAVEEFAKEV